MELALYCPKHGYYETKKDNPGRRGDFYTSVGVGEVFGQLLACQFAGWLEEAAECGARSLIVEAGAHDGRLARDILGWLQSKRPELFGQIEYWIIEPSAQPAGMAAGNAERISARASAGSVILTTSKLQTPNSKLTGVIFSNELLDAMPVHRFGWNAAKKTWFEWGVAVDGEKFVWAKNSEAGMPERESTLMPLHPPASIFAAGGSSRRLHHRSRSRRRKLVARSRERPGARKTDDN